MESRLSSHRDHPRPDLLRPALGLRSPSARVAVDRSIHRRARRRRIRANSLRTPAAQRAEKITASLALNDPAKSSRVQAAIARQYLDLHALHATRDARIATAKALPDKTAASAAVASAKASIDPELATLHTAYLERLTADLTPEQVDQVEDGMTYGVLPLTFRVYQQMLPDLTAAQKAQLLAWLTEAREHAMDGSTSDEKHAWFGKYKGKINNYLSAAGYDMKKAEKNLTKKS